MKFQIGELSRESFEVIMHDLECLELKQTKDNNYHKDLLLNNLRDIWGRK